MKFLEVNSLETINSAFRWESQECILTGRVEAYSCKSAGLDKKLFKTLENRYNIQFSESLVEDIRAPFGSFSKTTARKTFFYLLATLNAAFPDNDFEDVRPEQFVKLPSFDLVMNSINSTLFNLGNPEIVNHYRLWDVMHDIIQMNECEIYTFSPDLDDDPQNEEDGYL
ncbi:repressor of RNA polymerase III transcription Maf1 [Sporodiniella umbellata]|nr:repressor of RNA polymerase III transcription Maf1 [Sporodiniella umbellata]